MEKILIRFDEAAYNRVVRDIETYKRELQTFINQVKEISNLIFTQELVDDLIIGSGERTAAEISKIVNSDLDRAHIKSPSVRKMAVTGDLENFYTLFQKLPKPTFDLSMVKYSLSEDDQISIDGDATEKIKESFRYYIRTEKGAIVYEAQKKVVEALNDFLTLCPVFKNYIDIKSYIDMSSLYTKADHKTIKLMELDYDAIATMK